MSGKASVAIRTTAWLAGRGLLLSIQIGVLFFVAAFLYLVMYYVLVPVPHYQQPLFFDYRTKGSDGASVPTAYAQFVPLRFGADAKTGTPVQPLGSRFLHSGQVVDAFVSLRVPESPENINAGMFMLELEMLALDGTVIASTARPLMLRYKSRAVRIMQTVFYALPLTLGLIEEEQSFHLSLMPSYTEASVAPLHRVRVTLSNPRFHVYSASVRLVTRMSGISYYMYHYRLLSAFIGILGIVMVEAFLWGLYSLYIWLTRPYPAPTSPYTPSGTSTLPDMTLPSSESTRTALETGLVRTGAPSSPARDLTMPSSPLKEGSPSSSRRYNIEEEISVREEFDDHTVPEAFLSESLSGSPRRDDKDVEEEYFEEVEGPDVLAAERASASGASAVVPEGSTTKLQALRNLRRRR
mmetsp:Transcript_28017/g.45482  ORF Transcript_28017/g.45482 Transcript_28017/m.45482 type:complete len:410 (+) Transcript_28017:89-1318(+)|eukprot:CAMPEP_0184673862 /NCGR_PEP_ID=MMETSP0308-20130426/86912_1 /TAXON_ID=38269 /ORGANISM="Gloeochaete witrockiana, Strain SAG 46.84" /LENGTH=409 /DNA_ID=CAMNT_0027121397 /DNA_START=2888 /DNA_END=4117 /DNA_ORIENTATION=-